MFTGIVEELGTVRSRDGHRFELESPLVVSDAAVGDSIAVNGCCLTVVELGDGWWAADAVAETLSRTNLGELSPGDVVNLERPVRASDRLGGHIVQGHVDGTGTVRRIARDGDAVLVDVEVPPDVYGVTVLRGSIALSGVSLTVSGLPEPGVVRVSLIPFTLEHTTLGSLREGDLLNVEADVLAKLVAEQTRRWLDARADTGAAESKPDREAVEETHGIR